MVHLRLKDIKEYAIKNRVPIMQEDGIEFLINYIKENNIKRVLEIGSAIGYSAINIASQSEDIKVTTIEKDPNMYNIALNNIKNTGMQDRIKIIFEDALFVDIEEKYDLIFIDAAKSQYIKFFEKFSKNIDKGGVIVTDNLSFHGLVEDDSKTNNRNTKQLVKKIRKYIDFLKNNKDYDTTFYKIGDGISVSIKK